MKRRTALSAAAAIGMLLLILDGKTALAGAREGVELCIRTVVPTLLPFCVLSSLLVQNLGSAKALRPVCRVLKIPDGCESLVIIGLLGGYPMGAAAAAQLYRDEMLERKTANRLLMFCSNAGPSFLFGIVGPMFSDPRAGWALWAVHIAAAAMVALTVPGECGIVSSNKNTDGITVSTAVRQSVRTMASVSAWIVLFRIVIAFLDPLNLPAEWKVVLSGLLELTNGCCGLDRISDESLRFIAASGLLAFGGVCVCMQTVSVCQGLSIRSYLKGKLLQTFFSLAFSWILLEPKSIFTGLLVIGGILCHEIKKRSRKTAPVGV